MRGSLSVAAAGLGAFACLVVGASPVLSVVRFERGVEFSTDVVDNPGVHAMALVDVSVDEGRKPDLLIVGDGGVDIFPGDEELAADSDTQLSLPDSDGVPIAVAVGHFDNRGGRLVDVAVLTREPAGVRLFRNTPDDDKDAFDAADDFTVVDTVLNIEGEPRDIVVGRFNGDMRDDVAVLTSTRVYIFLSNGDSSASFVGVSPVATNGSNGASLVAVNLTNDAVNDIVVTDSGVLDDGSGDPDDDGQFMVFTTGSNGALTRISTTNLGIDPRGIAAGDFDGDGNQDLFVADVGSDGFSGALVHFIKGLGGGDFEQTTGIDAGSTNPAAVVVFDFDRDGTVDVATTSNGAEPDTPVLYCQPSPICVNVRDLPLEAGIWVQPSSGTIPGIGSGQVAIVAGELTGDGLEDFVVLSSEGDKAVLMINKSFMGSASPTPTDAVTFTPTPTGPTRTPTPTLTRTPTRTPTGIPIPYGGCTQSVGGNPVAVAIGNFDGGDMDIAYADRSGNRVGLLSSHRVDNATSACDFLGLQGENIATVTGPKAILATDLNLDGNLDLAVLGSESKVTLLRGEGDGDFTELPSLPLPTSPAAIAVADFDRDLNPDLVVVDGSKNVSLYLGTGGGSFGPRCTIAQGILASAVATDSTNAGDLNGDGWPDLVLGGTGSSTTGVLLRKPNSQTAGQCLTGNDFVATGLGVVTSQALLTGKFKASGTNNLPDIAVLTNTGQVRLYYSSKSSTEAGVVYPPDSVRIVDTRAGTTAIGTGDLFGLRRADLTTAVGSDDQVRIFKATGDGDYAVSNDAIAVGNNPVALAVGDVDGDPGDDTVTANSDDGSLSILISGFAPTPTPTLSPTVTPTIPTPSPSPTPSASVSPTGTRTPTATRTGSPTHTRTPTLTKTPDGVFHLNGSTCAVSPYSTHAYSVWIGLFGLFMARHCARRQRKG